MLNVSLKLLLVLSLTLSAVTFTYCAEEQTDDEVDITTSISSKPEITNNEKNIEETADSGKDGESDSSSDDKDNNNGVAEETDKTEKPESDSGDASVVTATESVTDSAVVEATDNSEQTIKTVEEVVTAEGITEVVTEVITGFVTEIQTEIQTELGVTEVIKDDVIDLGQGFDVKAANLVMDAYIEGMKKDVNADKLYLVDFKPSISSRWGSVQLHRGKVSGLSNAYRVGDILLKTSDFGHIKSFSGDVIIPNVIAKFKADIKLFNRINVRNRVLTITIDKLLAHLNLDLDVDKKKLIINSVEVKYLEGFKGRSGRLIWPLNKLADSILRAQQENIIKAIKLEVSKHMQKVVTDVNVENAITKLLTKH